MPTSVGSSTAGLPIDALITKPTASVPAQTGNGQVLGEDAFLKLLTTQLRYQNPMKPMDDTQTIAQLAQFSALQSQNELKSSFEKFQTSNNVLQAAALIGKHVVVQLKDANGETASAQGTVAGLQIVNGQPQFTLKDGGGNIVTDKNGQPQLFTTAQITGIT